MNSPTIDIIIDPEGHLQVEAIGFRGQSCEQATAFIEQALGPVTDKQRKPEYYQSAAVRNQQRLGQ